MNKMRSLFTAGSDLAEELLKDENKEILEEAKRLYKMENGSKESALFIKGHFEEFTALDARKAMCIIEENISYKGGKE